MRFPSPGHARNTAALRAQLEQLGAGFDLADDVPAGSALGTPLAAFGRTLGNRFCIHPMEGWDGTPEGAPSELTLRRWRRFGGSGAALLWGGEAFAVTRDGRANPNQLCLGQDSERHLVALRTEVQAGAREAGVADPVLGLQLTHSGRFCRPDGPFAPRIAHHHPALAAKYRLAPDQPLLSDGELEAIGEAMLASAKVAHRAGFAFVDVKCCHGYLLHELLAAHTRPGPYGGSLANRMRLFERIVAGIRRDCPGLQIGVRLSAADTAPYERDPETGVGRLMAMPHGWRQFHFGIAADDPTRFDLAEPLAFVQRAQQLGIAAINVTLGSPYWNPHLQRPAAYPPSDGYQPPFDPLLMVGQHLAVTRALKQACPALAFVGTGYTYLQEWLPHVALRQVERGFVDLIGLGRMVLAYPDLPRDVLQGHGLQRKRICRTFSDCTTAPRNGMVSGCFPLDPFYKDRPEAERVKQLTKDLRT
ncbi:MAG: NADH:flavin oxidoreductase [Planctomycetes bacterium]|nr:NADH:flavin oxidoreductase [Planctomycetota bacterium]